jgi:phospholipase/lecithinase/hemolysin
VASRDKIVASREKSSAETPVIIAALLNRVGATDAILPAGTAAPPSQPEQAMKPISASFLALLLAAPPLLAQPSISGVVAFGDSLSDAGNNGYHTNAASSSGYGIGGVWVQQLAGMLGYNLTASSAGGTDYAFAGSGTYASGPLYSSSTPGTAAQISSYLSSVGGKASPTALYTILSGANDVINTYYGEPSELTAVAQGAADNIKGQIITLINAGAKTIMWPSMGQIQYAPDYLGNTQLAGAVNAFNAEYKIDVAALRAAYPGVDIVSVDMVTASFVIGSDAPAFGLQNTTQAWTTAPASVPHSANSSNPDSDDFGSWDGLHPTTYLDYFTASNAYEALAGRLTNGTYQITNLNSGLALGTVGEGSADSVDADQSTNSGVPNQYWNIVAVGTNQYVISSAGCGRFLEVANQSTASGAAVDIYDSNGGNNQKWFITANSNGSYSIQGLQSGNYLSVAGGSTSSGALVNVSTNTGSSSQQWRFTATPVLAQLPTTGIVAFGDNWSDAGNNGYYTNTLAQSGYGLGGVWVQQLASRLGYGLTPSSSGGADYAFSGSGTFTSGSLYSSSTPGTAAQISSYLGNSGGTASPTVLYTVLSGANDIINTYTSNPSNLNTVAQEAADNIKGQIITLINAGAQRIVWLDMSAIQSAPNYLGNTQIAAAVSAFNAEYNVDVAALRSAYPWVDLVSVDVYTQGTVVNANAGAYGFWDTTQAWLTAPASQPYSASSSQPDADFFTSWDGIHPTTYVHYLTASNAYQGFVGGLTDNTYQIGNLNSGLALDTVGEGTADGVDVDQTEFAGAPTQQWNLVSVGTNQYLVLNVGSGRMLEVAGQSTASGALVDIYDSTGSGNQQWIITTNANGDYTIAGVQSGNYLSVAGASTGAGALIDVSTNTGASSQQWLFEVP